MFHFILLAKIIVIIKFTYFSVFIKTLEKPVNLNYYKKKLNRSRGRSSTCRLLYVSKPKIYSFNHLLNE